MGKILCTERFCLLLISFVYEAGEYPGNLTFLILGILKLYTHKVCEMFVYKHTETKEYVKK